MLGYFSYYGSRFGLPPLLETRIRPIAHPIAGVRQRRLRRVGSPGYPSERRLLWALAARAAGSPMCPAAASRSPSPKPVPGQKQGFVRNFCKRRRAGLSAPRRPPATTPETPSRARSRDLSETFVSAAARGFRRRAGRWPPPPKPRPGPEAGICPKLLQAPPRAAFGAAPGAGPHPRNPVPGQKQGFVRNFCKCRRAGLSAPRRSLAPTPPIPVPGEEWGFVRNCQTPCRGRLSAPAGYLRALRAA